jgi:uronate dehydrogenase
MSDIPAKPVLLTGASGGLGRMLARNLSAKGWKLVMTDITPFPDAMPAGCSFTKADLNDGMAIMRLAEGCGMILHFGGIATEAAFEQILGANLRGLYHIYEAARRERARVLFASSNHSIGFHERSETLGADCQFLPDTFYGLSKAYGELMGRLYWFKHGVENVNVRIGSSFPEPVDARMLSTWLSYDDLTRLCIAATLAPSTESCVIWGASKNTRIYWGEDARAKLGWLPQDTADVFAGQLAGKISDNPVNERYQGGAYTTFDYTRAAPPPRKLFR